MASIYSARHYEHVARTLKDRRVNFNEPESTRELETLKAIALDFSGYFQLDNDRYDHERFIYACGLWDNLQKPKSKRIKRNLNLSNV